MRLSVLTIGDGILAIVEDNAIDDVVLLHR